MFKDSRSCVRGATFSSRSVACPDLPLIIPCKGLVEVEGFSHLGCYLADMYLYAYNVKHVLGVNCGEGINAGSIMSLFHLLPVKVFAFCVCLPVFWLLVQHSSWNRLH